MEDELMPRTDNTSGAEPSNSDVSSEKKNKKMSKKKKAGIIIGVLGFAAAATMGTVFGVNTVLHPDEKCYTITFLTDEDVKNYEVRSLNVKDGTKVGNIKRQLAPLDGYEIKGFYKDKECKVLFSDEDVITSDIKIYIEYREIEAKVIFYGDDRNNTDRKLEVDVGYFANLDEIDIPDAEQSFVRGGIKYNFVGWQTLAQDASGHLLKKEELKGKTGKELIELDADGDGILELFSKYESENNIDRTKAYNFVLPEGLVAMRDGRKVSSGDDIYFNEQIQISADEESVWQVSEIRVNNKKFDLGDYFTVDSNTFVSVIVATHKYLNFAVKSDNTYEVVGYKTGAEVTDIVIPENHIYGRKVTSIKANAFANNDVIMSVVVGDTITKIEDNAFFKCTSLSSVTISDNTESVGFCAFFGCSNLVELTIGKNTTYLGVQAFSNCTKLESINIKSDALNVFDANSKVFLNAGTEGDGIDIIFGDEIQTIPAYIFENTNAKSVVFGNNVQVISNNAFNGCKNLAQITFGENIDEISDKAFFECTGLQSVSYSGTQDKWVSINFADSSSNPLAYAKTFVIGGSEMSDFEIGVDINTYAFYGFVGLQSVTIGNKNISIGNYAFYNCGALNSVTINDKVSSIGENSFYGCENMLDLSLCNSVNIIGDYAFYGCKKIQSEINLTNVETIGNYAFYDCNCISGTLNISKVQTLGSFAFYNCSLIENVVFGDNITIIKDSTFANCTALEGIVISNSVETIEASAFYGCSNAKSLTVGEEVAQIGESAFSGCNALAQINWNAISVADFDYSSLIFYDAGKDGEGISVTFGEKVQKIPAYCFSFKLSPDKNNVGVNISSVTLGNDVNSIGYGAFYNCKNLTGLTLNSSLEEISDYAFYGCVGLTELNFEDSLTTIGSYTFCGCTGVRNLTFGSGIKTIGTSAFSSCTGVTNVYWNVNKVESFSGFPTDLGKNADGGVVVAFGGVIEEVPANIFSSISYIKSVVFMGSIENLGSRALYNCKNITEIDIVGVKNIGTEAFRSCTGLQKLTIGEAVESISDIAFYDCSAIETITWKAKNVADFESNNTIFYNVGKSGNPNVEVTFTETVNRIPSYVFRTTTYLKSVVIGDSVESIGNDAFYNKDTLESLSMGSGVKNIGSYAFYKCANMTANLDLSEVETIGSYAFDGCGSNLTVSLGQGNRTIGDYAFYKITNLTGYLETTNLQTIGNYAFSGCSGITKIALSSCTSIGNSAFLGCNAIADLDFSNVKTIGLEAFKECNLLSNFDFSSITSIGQSAFRDCGEIESIILGDNVINISSYAFDGTTIQKVFFKGIKEVFNSGKITIGSYNTPLTSSQIYYLFEGDENPYDLDPKDENLYWHYGEDKATPAIWAKENQ